jgi:hypothetical protein
MQGKAWLDTRAQALVDEISAALKDIDQVVAGQAVEVCQALLQILNYKGPDDRDGRPFGIAALAEVKPPPELAPALARLSAEAHLVDAAVERVGSVGLGADRHGSAVGDGAQGP